MIARWCSTPGCSELVAPPAAKCPRHQPSPRSKPAHKRYSSAAWRKLSKQMREAQPWCSFCGSGSDLTLDHVEPGKGSGGYMVLCRSCNSAKGARSIYEAVARLNHPAAGDGREKS